MSLYRKAAEVVREKTRKQPTWAQLFILGTSIIGTCIGMTGEASLTAIPIGAGLGFGIGLALTAMGAGFVNRLRG